MSSIRQRRTTPRLVPGLRVSGGLFVVIFAAGCGERRFRYECSVPHVAEIGASHPLDCDVVLKNIAEARAIMAVPEFDAALANIRSIRIRDEDRWDWDGTYWYLGLSRRDGDSWDLDVNASMGSLAHEFGHVWLYQYVGDADSGHKWWDRTGQRARDIAFQNLAQRP